jgi:hypothetical protein
MSNYSHNRSISARSVSSRLWEDDQKWLVDYCRETGQKPAEVARELISEIVRMRIASSFPNSTENESEPSLVEAINSLCERIDHQEKMLSETYHLLAGFMMRVCVMNYLDWLQSRWPASPRNGGRLDRDGMAKGGRPR